MDFERWVVVGILIPFCVTMLVKPEVLTIRRLHRKPEWLMASRAVGALGLAGIAIMVVSHFAR